MFLATLLLAAQVADAQWSAILACPKVVVPRSANGTGVVIGTKDGFGYVLTAAHVIGQFDGIDLGFTSRSRYPKPVWHPDRVEVLGRWPDPDLALLRFPLDKFVVPVLPLAPAWQRPKSFPATARSVGWVEEPPPGIRGETIQAREFVRREGKQPAFFWRTTEAPEPGRSGGPLFDAHGRVIGIAVAADRGRGYYSHHDEILAVIRRAGLSWLISR